MRVAKRADWHTKPMPVKRSTLSLDRRFSGAEVQQLKAGLIPEQMEDKWFVYWEDDALFFHRSWTGNCIYIVRFVPEGDLYRMVEAEVNRQSGEYDEDDSDHDARLISYLIDALLLRLTGDFPSDESDQTKKALTQWSYVGRAMLGQHPKRPGAKGTGGNE